jgi:hypothetical protein
MNARLRTRWTVETFDKTESEARPVSTCHFDHLSQIRGHLDQHKGHRFVVHPPTAVHSDDLCVLDDLRQSGFDIERF